MKEKNDVQNSAKNDEKKPTKIVVCNQENLALNGISKVITSTEKLISVVMNGKILTIEGENLTVSELNVETGNLSANGKIISIKFTTEKHKDGILKRIFG